MKLVYFNFFFLFLPFVVEFNTVSLLYEFCSYMIRALVGQGWQGLTNFELEEL